MGAKCPKSLVGIKEKKLIKKKKQKNNLINELPQKTRKKISKHVLGGKINRYAPVEKITQ